MTATIIETAYQPYTTQNEHTIHASAEFIAGHDAARDEYGRPTECGTANEFDILEIHVDGIVYDGRFDDVFASQFWRYCERRKTHVRHTWTSLYDEISEQLENEI